MGPVFLQVPWGVGHLQCQLIPVPGAWPPPHRLPFLARILSAWAAFPAVSLACALQSLLLFEAGLGGQVWDSSGPTSGVTPQLSPHPLDWGCYQKFVSGGRKLTLTNQPTN